MRRGAAGSTGTWPFSGRAGAPCGGSAGGSTCWPPSRAVTGSASAPSSAASPMPSAVSIRRLAYWRRGNSAGWKTSSTRCSTCSPRPPPAAPTRRPRETGDDPDLDRVETQRLEVLQKRLGERAEMERNLEIVTSQIATLEHSIAYLADKLVSWSAAGRGPQGLREILAGGRGTGRGSEQGGPAGG